MLPSHIVRSMDVHFETEHVRFELDSGVLIARVLPRRILEELLLTEIEDSIREHLPAATKGLLVDCELVTGPVSSQFIGQLLHLRRVCKDRDLCFGLSNAGENIVTVLKLTNLDSVLTIYESVTVAVFHFCRDSDPPSSTAPEHPQPEPAATSAWRPQVAWFSAPAIIAASVIFLMIAGVVIWLVAAGITTRNNNPQLVALREMEARKTGRPFAVSLRGQINEGAEVVSGARVFAWPTDFEFGSQDLIAEDADSTPAYQPDWPRETTTDDDGRYTLKVYGRGKEVALIVLVVANDSARSGEIPHTDYSYLAAAFEHPDQLVGTNKYALEQLLVRRNREGQLDLNLE